MKPWTVLLAAFAALVAFGADAQESLWARSVSATGGAVLGDGRTVTRAVNVDRAGNVVLAGTAGGTGARDFVAAKLNSETGTLAWQKSFDSGGSDEAIAVAADAAGNVLVVGHGASASGSSVHVVKFAAADGAILWRASSAGPGDRGYAVAVDSAGNVIVGGESINAAGNSDLTVSKYSTSGALLWRRSIDNGRDDFIADLVLDGKDNILVAGVVLNANGNTDMLGAKLRPDGTIAWQKSFDGGGADEAYAIAVDAAGNVLVTGYATGGAGGDFHTIKYAAPDGALLWHKTFDSGGDDAALAVAVDGSGDVLVGGQSVDAAGGLDFRVVKYKGADGTVAWEKTYDSGQADHLYQLVVDAAGNAIAVGTTRSATAVDWRVVRYAAADGAIAWQYVYNGDANGADDAYAAVALGEMLAIAGISTEAGGATAIRAARLRNAIAKRSVITSPADKSTLTSSSATFTWDAGAGVTERFLAVGTAPGASDLYGAYQGGESTRTVSGLPTNGSTVHVRLMSWMAGGWQYEDYSYVAAGSGGAPETASARSEITSPAPGSTLSSSSVTFSWTEGSGVGERHLSVGSAPGSGELYSGYQGAALSRTVSGLPTDGATVHVRLLSWLGGGWQSADYTYSASGSGGAPPAQPAPSLITSPAPGSTLTSSSVTFTWSAGSGVSERYLSVGTTPGGGSVYAGYQGSALSRTISTLPTDGATVYVRLMSWVGGGWQSEDYTYVASGSGGSQPAEPTPSVITSPAPGSTLASTSTTFTWSAGSGVTERYLTVGTAPGASNIYGAYQGAETSRTVAGLPADASTVHVRLMSWVGGGWRYLDYTYTATR